MEQILLKCLVCKEWTLKTSTFENQEKCQKINKQTNNKYVVAVYEGHFVTAGFPGCHKRWLMLSSHLPQYL